MKRQGPIQMIHRTTGVLHRRRGMRRLARTAAVMAGFLLWPTAPGAAQLTRWILPPYIVRWDTGAVPQVDTFLVSGTNGPRAIVHDVNGAMLFYIVDGFIHDSTGEVIGEFPSIGSEITITPVASGRKQYDIVGVAQFIHHYLPRPGDTIVLYYSNYALLWGRLDLESQNPFVFKQILSSDGPSNAYHDILLAASNIQQDGHRYLFVKANNQLLQFSVMDTGVTDGFEIWQTAMQRNEWGEITSEMELCETMVDGEGMLRMAVPYYGGGSDYGDTVLRILVLDYHMQDIHGCCVEKETILDVNVGMDRRSNTYDSAAVPGLEFSPNGRYLYVTTVEGLKCFDICTNGAPVPVDYLDSTLSFMRSQIETGPDGNLYLAGPDGVARIENPDNAPGTWGGIVVPVQDLRPVGGPGGVYMLQDQIDLPSPGDGCELADVQSAHVERAATRFVMGRPYPSVTDGACTVPLTVNAPCHGGTLRIADAYGRTVLERSLESLLSPGEHAVAADLSAQPSGTYFVTVVAEGMRATQMIHVVR